MLTTLAHRAFCALVERAPTDQLRSVSRDFAQTILADMNSIHAVWHPLGFANIKVPITAVDSLRLHFWPSTDLSSVSASTQIHDHSWALTSFVAVGRLTNVTMDVAESQSGQSKYRVTDISYDGTVNHLRPTSRHVDLTTLKKETYRAGEIYEISPRVFHYTVVIDRPTVTLVAGTETPGRARQVVEDGSTGSRSVTRRSIGVAELSLLMEEINACV